MDVDFEHLVDSIHEGSLEAVRGRCCQDYFLVLLYAAPHLYHLFTSEFVDILGGPVKGQQVVTCGHDAFQQIGEDKCRFHHEFIRCDKFHLFYFIVYLPLIIALNSYSYRLSPQIVSGIILTKPKKLSCLMFLNELLLNC